MIQRITVSLNSRMTATMPLHKRRGYVTLVYVSMGMIGPFVLPARSTFRRERPATLQKPYMNT